jgi:hypothetical protein
MEPLWKGIASAVIAYTAHYGMVKVYSVACVPDGVWGFVQGLVTTGSPLCHAGVQIISQTQLAYSSVVTMGLTRLVLDWIAPAAAAAAPSKAQA